MINCEKCGNKLRDEANFCPFCGEDAPAVTRVFNDDAPPPIIENPIFCPYCQKENITDATFCESCAKEVYKIPSGESLFCPKCSKKNSSQANFCATCNASLSSWFAMEDSITTDLAHSGNFIFTETMNSISYHFITDNEFSIGRTKHNNLINPCPWISSKHCSFNLKSKYLIDNNSSNGVFVNRNSTKIDKFSLEQISEFNLSGSFTYKVVTPGDLFVFQLTAILEDTKCKTCGLKEKCEALRDDCYIFVMGDGELFIPKIGGKIVLKKKPNVDYFSINIKNGFYYFNDTDKNIENRLLKKEHNVLNKNWKFVL